MITKNNFNEIWIRLRSSTEIRTQKELAAVLGLTPQAVTEMKKRGKFPENWAYKLAEKYNLSAKWILEGTEKQTNQSREEVNRKKKFDILNEIEAWLDEITKKEPYRKEWFQAEIEDKFPAFKAWKEEKERKAEPKTDYPSSKVA
jgi:hypothetical protein